MNHPERLADYLEHIREAIDDAIFFLADCGSVEAFGQDRRSQYAVIRALEILGEAATRIHNTVPKFVADHPEIPWNTIRGMRNTLIHEYAPIDLDVVFDTVRNDLPPLRRQIAGLLLEQQRAHQQEPEQDRDDSA